MAAPTRDSSPEALFTSLSSCQWAGGRSEPLARAYHDAGQWALAASRAATYICCHPHCMRLCAAVTDRGTPPVRAFICLASGTTYMPPGVMPSSESIDSIDSIACSRPELQEHNGTELQVYLRPFVTLVRSKPIQPHRLVCVPRNTHANLIHAAEVALRPRVALLCSAPEQLRRLSHVLGNPSASGIDDSKV